MGSEKTSTEKADSIARRLVKRHLERERRANRYSRERNKKKAWSKVISNVSNQWNILIDYLKPSGGHSLNDALILCDAMSKNPHFHQNIAAVYKDIKEILQVEPLDYELLVLVKRKLKALELSPEEFGALH
ncbi:MAG: hypothetical protein DRP63_01495 [Planctomycetota bacterium]|nr:MAG: hypothetical protein DRP63_01495 [Planctomycetota bacterium]